MAAPSPHGRAIAYLTSPAPSDLVIVDLDGGGSRTVQRNIPPGVGTERPRWSPDGRWLSYNRWQLFGPSNLWLLDTASGESRQATTFTGSGQGIGSHAWLPDGKRILFSSVRDGALETWRVAAQGGPAEKVVDKFFRGDVIDRPDMGGPLLVTTSQGSESELRVIELATGSVRWQKRLPGLLFSLPVFSPDGTAISLPVQESRDRDAIWVLGCARIAALDRDQLAPGTLRGENGHADPPRPACPGADRR